MHRGHKLKKTTLEHVIVLVTQRSTMWHSDPQCRRCAARISALALKSCCILGGCDVTKAWNSLQDWCRTRSDWPQLSVLWAHSTPDSGAHESSIPPFLHPSIQVQFSQAENAEMQEWAARIVKYLLPRCLPAMTHKVKLKFSFRWRHSCRRRK